jgi:hypothetical protein
MTNQIAEPDVMSRRSEPTSRSSLSASGQSPLFGNAIHDVALGETVDGIASYPGP